MRLSFHCHATTVGLTEMTRRLITKIQNAGRIVRTRGIANFSGQVLRRLDRNTNWQITRLPRWMWWAIRMRANKGVCSIELNNEWLGFFAQMTGCLVALQYCERYGFIPDLRLTGVYDTPEREPNWLYHYFDRTDADVVLVGVGVTIQSGTQGHPAQ